MTIGNEELVKRLDHYSSYNTTPDEAFELFDEARSRCPVAHSDELGGFYLILDHADAKTVHEDWETFSHQPQIMRPLAARPTIPPLEFDPPLHTTWRPFFTQAVNPKTPAQIEDVVRADIRTIVEDLAQRESCDLVADFAEPIPLHAIAHVIGLEPSKGPEFRRLANEFIANFGDPDKVEAAMGAVAGFGINEVMSRRDDARDDYLTWLARAEIDGRPLEPAEIGMIIFAFLVAGQETTVNSVTSLLFEVLSRPDLRRQLIEHPDLIPLAVNESLRLHPPFIGFFRRTTRPVTIHGVDIPEDAAVQVLWAAANRDPEAFEDPSNFRLDRKRGTAKSLTFGHGIHACPGQSVARMEMRLALSELLRAIPDIQLTDPGAVRFEFNGGENCSIKSLPATLAGARR